MQEVAINVPFDANEIKEIAIAEFTKRLDQLSPIQGTKEYASFSLDFQVKINVRRAGEQGAGKDTLAWGRAQKGVQTTVLPEFTHGFTGFDDPLTETAEISGSTFQSKDPNEERLERDMPLTVETGDGRGGKVRKKVKVQAPKKAEKKAEKAAAKVA
jgi:hypothetical protein